MTYANIQLERYVWRGYAEAHVSTSFGKNVRRLMGASGLTQQDLVSALGVKQGTLSDWLRDRRGLPEGPTLIKFAKALRVTVGELIAGVDEEYDLLCHGRDQGSAPHQGGADVPASARRLEEFKQERDRYKAALYQVSDVAERLVEIAAVGQKGATALPRAPRGRRRHRKTG